MFHVGLGLKHLVVSIFVVVRINGISDGRVCQKLNIVASGYSRAVGGYGIYNSSSCRRFSSYYVGQMMNTVVRRRELRRLLKLWLPKRLQNAFYLIVLLVCVLCQLCCRLLTSSHLLIFFVLLITGWPLPDLQPNSLVGPVTVLLVVSLLIGDRNMSRFSFLRS